MGAEGPVRVTYRLMHDKRKEMQMKSRAALVFGPVALLVLPLGCLAEAGGGALDARWVKDREAQRTDGEVVRDIAARSWRGRGCLEFR